LHSDNSREYKSKEFDKYLAKWEIQHCFIVHNTPEHNGIAKQLNKILLEKVQAMLHTVNLPGSL